MRIDTLHIQNFKCFEDVTFELDPHFNVFIGDNGKGKTAVCDAIAFILFSSLLRGVHEITPESFRAIIPDLLDIRKKKIDAQWKLQFPLLVQVLCKVFDKTFDFSILSHADSIDENDNIIFLVLDEGKLIESTKYEIIKSRNQSGVVFSLLAFYGTGRLWGTDDKEIDYQKQEEGIMMAYPDCLVPNVTSKAFFSWYKTLEDEIKKFDRERDKIALKVVNEAITSMIPEWTSMAFSFREDDIIGLLDGEERYFRQLSDGYRNTIGMIADMIYRCIQLNPHLGENVLKETPGVVLIDELDLHLHPKWQRRIVGDLKRIFPKVQFVATTHSPFIVQSLEANELKNLDGGETPINPEDMSLNKIVTEIMNVLSIKSDDFENRYNTALKAFEILKLEEEQPLTLTDFNKMKGFVNQLLETDSNDPVYKAYLKATKTAKDETDK